MSKKLVSGERPPREGCGTRLITEIKVTASPECPMIGIRAGQRNASVSTWLVDSGAGESIIDQESFKEGFAGVELQPLASDIRFRTADGSPLQITGSFVTELWIGSLRVQTRIYVCKGVTRTRLIGGNVLSQVSHWGVDNRNRNFIFGDVRVPLVVTSGDPPRVCAVQSKKEVEIPAYSSKFVTAALPYRFQPSEMIFRPDGRMFSKHNLLVPVCLVANDFFDGTVQVKVTNPSEVAVTLHKGTKLGKVSDNVDEFDWMFGDDEPAGTGINKVQSSTKSEILEDLKREHEELYNLYMSSLKELNEDQQMELLQLLWRYKSVFSVDDNDLGTTNIIKHKIIPKSNKVVYRRQYRHSEEQHQRIDEEVQKLLDAGVIRESMSPYNNPVLMVPKAEKGKWRFCLDCRYINDLTEDQYFPIPRVDEVMDSLAGSTIFSDMDCTSGYHQVDLDDETSEMCAFSTRKGHFQYTKLPMGLRGSGMTFQKMITLLLSGMLHKEVLAYLDDCILFSASVRQHMETLGEVLKRFSEANLKLKPRKCHLFRESIVYLGYLIDKDGIRPNPKATELIRDIKEPKNVTEVQMFLGKANYYRKFVPKLADIAHPLYELVKSKGKCPFQWEAEHQTAFDTLKSVLCSGQVMGHPRFEKEFVLDVDASDYALGAELSQEDDEGNLRPIYHASRHLEKAERNYSATARETLAAVFGCEFFRQYLQGKKFILRSDHNPLVWLRRMKEPKRPYSGWIVRLEQFDYTIKYRPGKLHINADFNSRVGAPEKTSMTMSQATQTEEDIGCRQVACSREGPLVDSGCVNTTMTGVKPNHGGEETRLLQTMSGSAGQQRRSEEKSQEDLLLDQRGVAAPAMGEVSKECVETPLVNKGCGVAPVVCTVSEGGDHLEEVEAPLVNKGCGVAPVVCTVSEGGDHLEEVDVPSPEVVSVQQRKDPDIGPVIQKLEGDEDVELTEQGKQLWRKRGKLRMVGGLLVRDYQLREGLSPIEQVVLPGCMRHMVMESLHDSLFAGHFALKRTLARVRLRYYWPGYNEDVEQWCQSCLVCQERKPPPNRNIAPLTSIDTGQGPFEQVALDILKLPKTHRNNQYLLVIEDYFSKWVEAFPLVRTAAPSVAQCVLNGWIARFGCPFTILSDQGPEFESLLFKELNEMLQVKKMRTTTYHPRTDGMVERSNRTVIDILSKYAEGEPDWDLKLPIVLFALRTSEHATTGFSPFLLTYGREARLPWDILYGPAPTTPTPLESWVADRKQHMTSVFQMVKDHTKRRQLQQKEYFDKNRSGRFVEFKAGDKVMYCDPASRKKYGKLHRPWSGPHKVIRKATDSLYVVEVGEGKPKMVNAERLKHFYDRTIPGAKERVVRVPNRDEEETQEVYSDEEDGHEVEEEEEEEEEEEVDQQQPGDLQHQVRNGQVQEIDPQPPGEPLMGARGQLWCNLNPSNIVQGGRRARKD